MSTATTTVYLYIGFEKEVRAAKNQWPHVNGGHIELVSWLETMAEYLDSLYDREFAQLELSVVFDYEITEELGAWLFHNNSATACEFENEARRIVALAKAEDDKLIAKWAENDARLEDKV